jgi:hypothetical protein
VSFYLDTPPISAGKTLKATLGASCAPKVAFGNSPELPGRRRPDRTGEGAADTDHSGGYVIGADDTMPCSGSHRLGATPPRERGNVTQERPCPSK